MSGLTPLFGGFSGQLMSKPEFDHDDPDAESMFNFLQEDGHEPRRGKPAPASKSMPIIRKPVPVSESGPLLPPKPGDPVEPPPPLTAGLGSKEKDDQFLDRATVDMQSDVPASTRVTSLKPALEEVETQSSVSGRNDNDSSVPTADDDLSDLSPLRETVDDLSDLSPLPETVDDLSDLSPLPETRARANREPGQNSGNRTEQRTDRTAMREADEFDHLATPVTENVAPTRKVAVNDPFDELDGRLDHDDNLNFGRDWQEGVGERFATKTASKRGRWLALAILLLGVGLASFVFISPNGLSNPPGWLSQWFPGDQNSTGTAQTDSNLEAAGIVAPGDGAAGTSVVASSPGSSLFQRFQDQLQVIEIQVAEGQLDAAEDALANMDRSVYGYGAFEFGELEKRIQALRSGSANSEIESSQSLAASQSEAEQARLAEQLAREEALRAEQLERQTQLAAQAAREEEARLAEQAAREEEARLAAQEEEAGLAGQAAQEEEARQRAAEELVEQQLLVELAALEEQARLAEQATAQDADQDVTTPSQIDLDRQATDRRVAEELAAIDRARASAQQSAETTAESDNGRVESRINVSNLTRTIGDDDLQLVYQRFIDLQQAILDEDIETMLRLTQRSVRRVQQFQQMFANSSSVEARIRNVSTSNATGEIYGTLVINKVIRDDGRVTGPAPELASIALISVREGDGWSAIRW